MDVFTEVPYMGNPVAVVHGADGLTTEAMQRFAHWTNLSETTFLLAPEDNAADYRVRIFTPLQELPFAGHPTLGSCHAWLEAGGAPRDEALVVQECAAGLIKVRRDQGELAFAEPPLLRSGPVDDGTLDRVAAQLRIARDDIEDAQWADNGPGWVAVLLASAEAVLAVRPEPVDMDIGVAGLCPPGAETALEVRAFFPKDGATVEDPVTGSLNASLAGWLIRAGRLEPPYLASQGTALGRAGRVRISRDDEGVIWVGGSCVTCVEGMVSLA